MLAKADLQTEIVGEFPELQGAMGRKYALLQGEHPSVAAAIEEHYKPQGPSDRVPTDPVSIAVALADKLDTLVGFWAIDEKPTGSQGPVCAAEGGAGGDQDSGGEWGQSANRQIDRLCLRQLDSDLGHQECGRYFREDRRAG